MPQTPERVVVYRGLEASVLDMVEAMLEVEGMEPHRSGRSSPALAGVGMYAVEQRIDVPLEHAEGARALVDAFAHTPDAAESAELEAQALQSAPVADTAPRGRGRNPDDFKYVLLLLCVAAGLLWLLR